MCSRIRVRSPRACVFRGNAVLFFQVKHMDKHIASASFPNRGERRFFLCPPRLRKRRAEGGTGGEWRWVSSPRALWMRCVHGVPSAALWWLKVAHRGYLRQAPVCVTMIEREESLGSHLPKHINQSTQSKLAFHQRGTLISKVQCRIIIVDTLRHYFSSLSFKCGFWWEYPSIFYCNILLYFGAFIGALIN